MLIQDQKSSRARQKIFVIGNYDKLNRIDDCIIKCIFIFCIICFIMICVGAIVKCF